MKYLIAALIFGATSAQADPLMLRYEAASEAFDGQLMRVLDADPAQINWTAARRAQSTCALSELETRRGRKVAEKYVKEYERAAAKARKLKSVGDFASLTATIHRRSGISFSQDLVPITSTCGIGL